MGFAECVFNWGGLYECQPSWTWSLEGGIADFDLWLVVGGHGLLESGGRSYELGHGDCFILPPGTSLDARHDPERPLRVLASHFDYAPGCVPDPLPGFHRNLGASSALVASLMTRTIAHAREGRKAEAGLWLGAALSAVAEHDAELARMSPGLLAWNAKIQAARDRIDRSPGSRLDVAKLARSAGLSRDHFTRVFKRVAGRTPEDYAVERRMERARALLSFSNSSVSEIAAELGYSSLFFFSRQFKERNGVSPKLFREGAFKGPRP